MMMVFFYDCMCIFVLRLFVVEIDEKIKIVCINLCFDNRYFKIDKLFVSVYNVSVFVFEFVF